MIASQWVVTEANADYQEGTRLDWKGPGEANHLVGGGDVCDVHSVHKSTI